MNFSQLNRLPKNVGQFRNVIIAMMAFENNGTKRKFS